MLNKIGPLPWWPGLGSLFRRRDLPTCQKLERSENPAGTHRKTHRLGADRSRVARKLWKRTRVNEGRIGLYGAGDAADSKRDLELSRCGHQAPT
jgi:hypothetical protein